MENNVFDTSKIDLSTTKIAYECLTEPEQKVMDKAHEIYDHWTDDSTLTESQRKILDTAGTIMTARIGWLFDFQWITLLCRGDKIAEMFFHSRLFWFIDEMMDFIHQYLEEQRIYDQKGKTWKQKEKEFDEGIGKTWKKPFTPESYTAFMKPVYARMRSDLKKGKSKND